MNQACRTAGQRSDAATIRVTNKQRVASRGVERTGLTADEISTAEDAYRKSKGITASDGKGLNYPDLIYRAERKRPLLILHLLKIDDANGGEPTDKPVVAWSIDFPRTELEEKRVEYVVNTTWLRENFRDEADEEEMGGDDE